MNAMSMGVHTFYRHDRSERSAFMDWLKDVAGPEAASEAVSVTLVDEGGAIDITFQPREVKNGYLVPCVTTRYSADVPPPWFEVGP